MHHYRRPRWALSLSVSLFGLAGWGRSYFYSNGVVRFFWRLVWLLEYLVDCEGTSGEKWLLNDCMVGWIGECIYFID